MKRGPTKQTRAAREKISSAQRQTWARRRKAGRVPFAEIQMARDTSTISKRAALFSPIIADVFAQLVEDQGGPSISAARRSLLEGHGRLLLAESLCALRILQEPGDLEAMARLTALVGQRRATLIALGLDRVARDVPSLAEYIAARDAEHAANGDGLDEDADALDAPQSDASESDPAPNAENAGDVTLEPLRGDLS